MQAIILQVVGLLIITTLIVLFLELGRYNPNVNIILTTDLSTSTKFVVVDDGFDIFIPVDCFKV